MNLTGRVAIITGGGKAIGGVISRRFLNAGADLILIARTLEPMVLIAEEGKKLGQKVIICQEDTSHEDVADWTVKHALMEFGRIDVLVNNTGIEWPNAPVTDISLGIGYENVDLQVTRAWGIAVVDALGSNG